MPPPSPFDHIPTELLMAIFECVPSRIALSNCAIVCVAWSGPATEIMWKKRLVPLNALLGLLPQRLLRVSEENEIKLESEPVPSDWKHLQERGTQIRCLSFHGIYQHLRRAAPNQSLIPLRLQPHVSLLSTILLQYRTMFVLPSLRELDFSSDGDQGLAFSLLFARSPLVRIRLSSNVFWTEYLQRLHEGLDVNKLEVLELNMWDDNNTPRMLVDIERLPNLLLDLANLRDIKLHRNFLTHQILNTISGLPLLEVFEVEGRLPTGVLAAFLASSDPNNHPTTTRFSSLVSFRMTISPGYCAELFANHIASTQVASVDITILGNITSQVQSAIEAIVKRCQNLHCFRLQPDDSFYTFIEGDTRMHEVYDKPYLVQRIQQSQMTLHGTLGALGRLEQLRELYISWPYPLIIDLDPYHTLFATWCNTIEVLYLNPSPFFIMPHRPMMKFHNLRNFARLTKLKKLALFMDATSITLQHDDNPTMTREIREKIRGQVPPYPHYARQNQYIRGNCYRSEPVEFDPGRSWVSDPRIAANNLLHYFPGSRLADTVPKDNGRWKEVAALMRNSTRTNWEHVVQSV